MKRNELLISFCTVLVFLSTVSTHASGIRQTVRDFGAAGDPDGDNGDNLYEFNTGTHPQRAQSIYRIMNVSVSSPVQVTVSTVPDYSYAIEYIDGSLTNPVTWAPFANQANGVGTWLETSGVETNFTFEDDFTPATSGGAPVGDNRFYRIRSTAP